MVSGNIDELTYSKYPSSKSVGKDHIIIVGGGIIGATTAYYLTKHPNFDPNKHYITLIESSEVAGGASGKAGGLIASWAFPEQIVPLSFHLHEELNQEYDGETNWGYRRLNALSVEADLKNLRDEQEKRHLRLQKRFNEFSKNVPVVPTTELENGESKTAPVGAGKNVHGKASDYIQQNYPSAPPMSKDSSQFNLDDLAAVPMGGAPQSNGIPDDLSTGGVMMRTSHSLLPMAFDWVKQKLIKTWNYIGETETTAQIHPYKFTHFLLTKAMETGAVELIKGKVNEIQVNDENEACGVSYIPRDSEDNEVVNLVNASKVLLSVGPWTPKLLKDCPISSLRVHSVIVKPENTEENPISPYSLFSEIQVENNRIVSPEIYPRKDEIYICGEGDAVDLPDSIEDIKPNDEICNELYYYVSKLSSSVSHGEITDRFASYLPVLNIPTGSGPLLGETNMKNLYIATGHSCWGINNAPATGLIMSQLMLEGDCTCAEISVFNPKLYFDATKLN
ncbi:hypothetical protein Kpol_1018p55 [Vanderwaltozyma polyspora DSM 70294]|uniref:FAD dependent oxidoreductase domain-containing protein n=1 Tax=Vanderwaltozyma polyspora (strain ATCC 22028 / DSM 70294 / BCRC 21397 / CBS 2163 / NBRC 10782 / NRRL Y-8283 / UCD 57-17) TaxID=436907 RepID=A7TDQ3_VANPO|nr:uncharacterized protein Kpol_1018p55 [Vanderwaltozyma polyspora DSM 70294]EDO19523.1 hypothetical protein Kpol_1018p55 [Vanderwaltozyma polyspora DSM 70294]